MQQSEEARALRKEQQAARVEAKKDPDSYRAWVREQKPHQARAKLNNEIRSAKLTLASLQRHMELARISGDGIEEAEREVVNAQLAVAGLEKLKLERFGGRRGANLTGGQPA